MWQHSSPAWTIDGELRHMRFWNQTCLGSTEREGWRDGLTDGRRRPMTCSTMEGSGTSIDEGAWQRGNLRSMARRSENIQVNAAAKCCSDDGGPLTGEEEGCGAFGSDYSSDLREKVAQRLALARRQAAPACGGGRVSGGRRHKERGAAALLTGVEARHGEWRRLWTGLPEWPYTGARVWHRPGQPIRSRRPMTEWQTGGSHLPVNFSFLEIPQNKFPCMKYIYIYIYI
jgi:hypothetical protein